MPAEMPSEERKLVTVLFTDIVGSTAAAEQLDPEDVRARLNPYYTRLRAELERFGGTVEKFIGDAVVALFGAPVAHEDDPERAVRAALAIRTGIDELNAEDEWLDLKIRIGVNTGEALVVVGARASEGEGMAAGDVMNTAARLQSAAPVNGILVGELTYRATADAIEYRDTEPIAAKGKSERVRVWEAVALREQPEARAPSRSFVGRDEEVRGLIELWDSVRSESIPALVTVVGPPGIGKSRLVDELTRRAADDGAAAFWGRCLPYGEGITYWPVADVLKAAAGILQSDAAETVAERLGALLEGLQTDNPDELRTMAAAAANLLGTETTPRGTYSATSISQAELHWGFRRIVELLARRRPLVLVFEDLHWAEPTMLELVRFLTGRDVEAPLLVVGTSRPELGDSAPGLLRSGERQHALVLDALPAEAGEALLAELLGDRAPGARTVRALLENAGGNPLFLEETVRMLADSGLSEEDVDELPVPTSLQSLIAARLDQLPTSQKQTGQHASVVGRVFWPGAVAHLRADGNGTADGAALRTDLRELERRDFVHSQPTSSIAGEDEFVFKHILIRDVAYGQLPKGRRIGLHVRFADWVEALPSGEEEFVEILAWHLEQACRLAGEVAHSPVPPPVLDATRMLARAAEKAERREGIAEANRFYVRALEVLGELHPDRALELRLQQARTLALLGELKAACEQLEATSEGARAAGRAEVLCEALVTLANVDQRQGRPSDARGRLEEAQSLVADVGDRRLRVRTDFSVAALRADFDADAPAAVDALRRAIALAEELDDASLAAEGHLRTGYVLFNSGDLAGSEAELRRCYELAEDLGSRRDQTRATFLLALITYYRGDLAEAQRLGLQARDWLDRIGEPYFKIQNYRALGLYALARDEPEAAEEWFRCAVPIALEEGGRHAYELYRYLVEALARQGRVVDAADLVEFAARGAPPEDLTARAYVGIARGLVATEQGNEDTARDGFTTALHLFEEQSFPIDLAEVRVTYGRALRRLGSLAEARSELELARETFLTIGADGVVRTLDRELAELERGAGQPGPARSASG
jgi:predicted ATPase/class 3 adenylate cyclase